MDDQISKICLWQNSIFEKKFNIHEIFCKIHEIFFMFLFHNVHKENMFTIGIEDEREAF